MSGAHLLWLEFSPKQDKQPYVDFVEYIIYIVKSHYWQTHSKYNSFDTMIHILKKEKKSTFMLDWQEVTKMNTFGVSSKNLRPKIFSFLIYAKSMLHEFANKFYDLYITETKNWIYIYSE